MNIPNKRRDFLRVIGTGGIGIFLTASIANGYTHPGVSKQQKEEEVSPIEDLMREHGLLNRILLIYEEIMHRLAVKKPDVQPYTLKNSVEIIRQFVEEYHEKLEEDYLFPRFEKAGKHVDLVKVLRRQHQAGRNITEKIISLSTEATFKNRKDRSRLNDALRQFIHMYRPHASREDTVLFPALHSIVTTNEYDALGEEFEKKEQLLFGEEGFFKMVDKVAGIEKTLGIYDLSTFTQ
jgi:hemerythrin-like domain-containing protein